MQKVLETRMAAYGLYGPSLPDFITPNVLNVLVKNYNLMPISNLEKDLKAILG